MGTPFLEQDWPAEPALPLAVQNLLALNALTVEFVPKWNDWSLRRATSPQWGTGRWVKTLLGQGADEGKRTGIPSLAQWQEVVGIYREMMEA